MAITSRMANGTDTKTCHEQIGDTATRLPINNHGTSLTPEKRTSLAIADNFTKTYEQYPPCDPVFLLVWD